MDEKQKKQEEQESGTGFFYGLRIVLRAMFKVLKVTFKTLCIFCVIALLILVAIGGYKLYPMYKEYKGQVKDVVANSTPEDFRMQEPSFIYDADGNLMAKLAADEDSSYLYFNEIPENAVNAFIAIEDRTFWENSGIDVKGIIRVGLNYFRSEGEEVHGASTITQQLARNRFLTREVSIERKAKEILIALDLTKKYTKEQIMEFYVNDINYANTYYGLEAAARGYFGKSASELTLSQTAYLCAIPNSPTYYNPYNHPENAIKRRDKILGDMKELGFISERQYWDAIHETIAVEERGSKYTLRNYETTYAIDCAVRYLMKLDGFYFQYGFQNYPDYTAYKERYDEAYSRSKDELYTGGYTIYTSLEPAKQQILQESIDGVLSFDGKTAENGVYLLQGAATVVDNRNNRVVAIVGGRSQETTTYTLNRAFQSFRQPGSTIKPIIVYAPALDNGYTSDSIVRNINVSQAKVRGVDVKSLPGGGMTLREAVEKSRNGAAWWVYNDITPNVGMSYLTKMRFDHIVPDDYYPAAALGGFTYGTTTEEMAGAYSALADGGIYREPTCITRFLNNKGEEIFREYEAIQVYKQNTAAVMTDILQGVIKRGTAHSMGWNGNIEAAGKTGTTNGSKDGWFCGMTPYYSMSVWVGYDQPKMLSSLYGATYPASIWKQAMVRFVEGMEAASFSAPGEEVGTQSTYSGKYLPGRNDDEVLSNGYTVGNYRHDHELADQVNGIIAQMSGADEATRQALYGQAQALANQIYGNTLKREMTAVLQSAITISQQLE